MRIPNNIIKAPCACDTAYNQVMCKTTFNSSKSDSNIIQVDVISVNQNSELKVMLSESHLHKSRSVERTTSRKHRSLKRFTLEL